MQYNQSMEIAPVFAVILLLAVIGFLMNALVELRGDAAVALGLSAARLIDLLFT